jgi:hypothetical protein
MSRWTWDFETPNLPAIARMDIPFARSSRAFSRRAAAGTFDGAVFAPSYLEPILTTP